MNTGMGVSPLQIGQLLDWFRLRGIEDVETQKDYAFFIFELDDEFIAFCNKKPQNNVSNVQQPLIKTEVIDRVPTKQPISKPVRRNARK